MSELTGITIGGVTYDIDPFLTLSEVNEGPITTALESILGGAFLGKVIIDITDAPDPTLDPSIIATITNTPFPVEALEFDNPRGTYPFIQSDCASAVTLAGSGCSDDDAILSLIASLKRDFPTCCRTGSSEVVSGEVIPTGIIYYGNSAAGPLNEAGILALSSTSVQIDFEGSFAFIASDPSEYKTIAIPVSFGTPTSFYDPSTGFNVPFETAYQVTVATVPCNVFRTTVAAGGAVIITLI